jgi:lipopolysaccharide heptosyltransferase II
MANINKILFITLSNIGDVMLTLPALDYLRRKFPEAKITVVSGARPKEIFENNPAADDLIVYDKHARLKEKIKLFRRLKKEGFDMVVDLRNSFFGLFLSARHSVFLNSGKCFHMKDRHLSRVHGSGFMVQGSWFKKTIESSFCIGPEDQAHIEKILENNNIGSGDKVVVIAAGARSATKIWPKEKFARLIERIIEELNAKVILVGDKADAFITKYISEHSACSLLDLAGKTTISQLGALLRKASLLVTNDSAVLHLASYLDKPIVAIFGPTSDKKYGPWSVVSATLKKEIFCRPCQKAECRFKSMDCLHLIKVEDVLKQVKNILVQSSEFRVQSLEADFKRILIARTDRVGDVLLSTPVIEALRDRYPNAYIAMMVSPYAREIVQGNPYLDEVIIYDKDAKHKSWLGSMRFASKLRKKKFDLALILHPTNRVHLVAFFAGIPRRIGYDRKMGFLLTDRLKHTKQLGEKHELDYNLQLLSPLGITPKDKRLYMPLRPEAEIWAKSLLLREGVKETDKLLAIHPGASCPSKIWPNERFAEVADRLKEKYGFKTIIISGPKDMKRAEAVLAKMRSQALDLAGKTSLAQLASLLKRCSLFISNDSGPVHIASAIGTPVISIFGRNQKGLSPKRWGPTGKYDRYLHKEVGCIECLAHNCKKEFACLKAISVDDVLAAADSILKM